MMQMRLCSADFENPTDGNGSAAPGRLIKLRTLGLHEVLTSAATSSATASGHGRVQADVGLRRLHFKTGRWGGGVLADWMTASGRDCQFTAVLGS